MNTVWQVGPEGYSRLLLDSFFSIFWFAGEKYVMTLFGVLNFADQGQSVKTKTWSNTSSVKCSMLTSQPVQCGQRYPPGLCDGLACPVMFVNSDVKVRG